MGPFWTKRGKKWVKNVFFKSDPRPFGMLKPRFVARFEPVVTRFAPWEVPKCLENGSFLDQKGSEVGQKCVVPKSGPRPFGMRKWVFLSPF